MSAKRLVIDEIEVAEFGGLRDRRIVIPDDRFVVLQGPNESGKSTLAQLLASLLVGPSGSADDWSRFGDPNEQVGGRLLGSLGGTPFVANGKFKVLVKGAPNARGLSVEFGGSLGVDDWRKELGGIDDAVLAGIYRLWGEDLHRGATVESKLLDAARGAYGTAANLGQTLEALDTKAKEIERRIKENGKVLDEKRGSLKEIELNVTEYTEKEDELRQLNRTLEDLEARAVELREQRDRIAKVLDVLSQTERLEDLRVRRSSMTDIPDGWRRLAEDPTALVGLIHTIREHEQVRNRIDADLTPLLATIQLDHESLAGIHVDRSHPPKAKELSTKLAGAESSLQADRATRAQLARESQDAASHLEVQLDRMGIGRAVPPDPALTRQIASGAPTELAQWEAAVVAADQSRVQLEAAEGALRDAEAALADRESEWTARGTGLDPAELIRQVATGAFGVAPTSPERTATTGVRRWVLPGIIALIAVVAGVRGEWILTGLLAAVALIAAGAALRQRPDARRSGVATTEVRAASVEDIFASAQAVMTARTTRIDADRKVTTLRELSSDALTKAESCRKAMLDALGPFASTDILDPAAGRRRLEMVHEVITLQDDERSVAIQLENVDERLSATESEVASLREQLAELARTCGLTRPLEPAQVFDTLDATLAALELWRRRASIESELTDTRSNFDSLIVDVAGTTQDWRLERIAEEAERLGRQLTEQRTLDEEIRQVTGLVDAGLGQDPATRSLWQENRTSASLDMESESIDEEIGNLQAELNQSRERVGVVTKELEILASLDLATALRTEIGSLDEVAAELSTELSMYRIASGLLRTTTDEFVRTNQPDLVKRASELACSVTEDWTEVVTRPDGNGGYPPFVRQRSGREVAAMRLSTGARGLLYLAFRIALAEHDAAQRGVRFPLICDDPFVHLDDDRAHRVLPLLAQASEHGHQVLLFTCHQRTVDAALSAGGRVVHLPSEV